jgi:hypothetical protein
MGNVYEGASFWDAYGEQPKCSDYSRGESCEYQMKIDFPSFNRHLHIKYFLYWAMEVEKFFDYMSIPKGCKVKLVVYKFEG